MIQTPLTQLLNIKHPIILAGMANIANAELAASVTNAGGLGVLGGVTFTPEAMRKQIKELKSQLINKDAPFGVDLLIPQVGGNARKTNKDYTHGHLEELIDIIIESKCKLFVCAVGVPPEWAVKKLRSAGILCANMIGSPRNAEKAIEAGMQILIAQGTEAGGHTGDIATLPLIRHVVKIVKKYKVSKYGEPLHVVAAGGIADGQALAAALALGAEAVWVGTRFICAEESGASLRYRETVMKASPSETLRSLVISGRPLRLYATPYIKSWEVDRKDQIQKLCDQGIIPIKYDYEQAKKRGETLSIADTQPLFMGQVAGLVSEVKKAKDIIEEMIHDAVETIEKNNSLLVLSSKI